MSWHLDADRPWHHALMNPKSEDLEDTEAQYLLFVEQQAKGSSPVYERLCLAILKDSTVLQLLSGLPSNNRQPNLLFGALRWCYVPVEDPDTSLAWIKTHWPEVLEILKTRRTQTNEVNRCATLLPALALLPAPLALIEVGASAGLCLLYDQWRYHYFGTEVDHWVGSPDSQVTLNCTVSGPVPLPNQIPNIVWRVGLDLNPLNANDPDHRRWLECLVWPEDEDRAATLSAALNVSANQSLRIERGDLVRNLPNLLDQAPKGATVVVMHSATLTYASLPERSAFLDIVASHGAHRIGAEGPKVLPHLTNQLPDFESIVPRHVISIDDKVFAFAHPHGRSLRWL
jgi:hypothetical protein